jgi:hypothetical protein
MPSSIRCNNDIVFGGRYTTFTFGWKSSRRGGLLGALSKIYNILKGMPLSLQKLSPSGKNQYSNIATVIHDLFLDR